MSEPLKNISSRLADNSIDKIKEMTRERKFCENKLKCWHENFKEMELEGWIYEFECKYLTMKKFLPQNICNIFENELIRMRNYSLQGIKDDFENKLKIPENLIKEATPKLTCFKREDQVELEKSLLEAYYSLQAFTPSTENENKAFAAWLDNLEIIKIKLERKEIVHNSDRELIVSATIGPEGKGKGKLEK